MEKIFVITEEDKNQVLNFMDTSSNQGEIFFNIKIFLNTFFKNHNKSLDFLERIKSEIEILKKVKHNNICKLFSIIETEERIYLIQEFE